MLVQVMRGLQLQWHTRHGAPHNLRDLDRVNAGHARTVILLEPEEGEVISLESKPETLNP